MPHQDPLFLSEVISEASEIDGPVDYSKLSLESLLLLIHTEKLRSLRDRTNNELNELKDRQGIVRNLHKLLRHINTETDEDGNFDCSRDDEIVSLLKQMQELGIEVDSSKTKYSTFERDRLIENLRMAVEDFNVQNDMQLQSVSRLTNERYECYQMARSILKPLSDDKLRKAREISGR